MKELVWMLVQPRPWMNFQRMLQCGNETPRYRMKCNGRGDRRSFGCALDDTAWGERGTTRRGVGGGSLEGLGRLNLEGGRWVI